MEDNPADADLLQETLNETSGVAWSITHVERLDSAIEAIRQFSFNIVLSDLSLPDAQGLDSIIQIHSSAPELPVVVLTGLDDEDIGLKALRQGAQDYLVKGEIQPELLVRTIRYAIERSHTQHIMRQQAAAMAASMEGIAILNHRRECVYVNQAFAKLHGYDCLEELMNTNLDMLYNQVECKSLWQLIKPVIEQQSYWRGEVIAHHSTNEISHQEILITVLNDGGYVCNARDINNRKKTEAEMLQNLKREKELNELKSRFVSIVSHEFRTPLTTILSSVELLQKYSHHVTAEKNQIRFSRIVGGVHRMTQLLNDLLTFNKAEVGQLHFKPVSLNIVEFCQDLIEEMQLQVGESHYIKLASQFCDDKNYSQNSHSSYLLDDQLLRHILSNLIFNAVKYSPAGSEVSVKVFGEHNQLIFRISDQGIGIPLGDLEQLFAVFYRASNVGTIPGTGLGLAIVKQCVDLHKGSIKVISEINKGTEFTVILPITSGEDI